MTGIVDERQRLVARLRAAIATVERFANREYVEGFDNEYAQLIRGVVRPFTEAVEALASPSEGNKKGDAMLINWNERDWLDRLFAGHGMAMRRENDPPIPGEPLMSMQAAKEITLRAVASMREHCARTKENADDTANSRAGGDLSVVRRADGNGHPRPAGEPTDVVGQGAGRAAVAAVPADADTAGIAASRPQEQPRTATEQEVDAACRAYAIAANKPYIPEAMVAAITAAVNIAVSTVSISPAAAQGWQEAIELLRAMEDRGETGYHFWPTIHPPEWVDRRDAILAAAPPSPAAQEQEKGEQT